ncbi:MAG: hypothetical protein HYT11_00390 [Candidatus Levybacteria bacterium]|nr:hypothetical protein [Candidatus Levybacteria bacterium]
MASLFEAIESNDIENIKKIEHVLTRQEECVACTYLLKAGEPAATVLSRYLAQEGILVVSHAKETPMDNIVFWLLRSSLFASSILIAFGIESIVRQIALSDYTFGFPSLDSLGMIEFIAIGVISFLIFLIIDDRFID